MNETMSLNAQFDLAAGISNHSIKTPVKKCEQDAGRAKVRLTIEKNHYSSSVMASSEKAQLNLAVRRDAKARLKLDDMVSEGAAKLAEEL